MDVYTIKNGEGKWFEFTIKKNGVAQDVSAYTFKFGIKKYLIDTTYKVEKNDGSFDKSQSANGIVKVNLPASENTEVLLPPGKYFFELKITVTADTDVDKSVTSTLLIEKALIHD